MREAMGRIRSKSFWQHSFVGGFLAASLLLIFWAGAAAWQYSCWSLRVPTTSKAAACLSRLRSLELLIVEIGFWSVGLITWYLRQSCSTIAFFLLSASVLAAGQLSLLDSLPGSRIFLLVLIWIVPLAVHFHLMVFGRVLRPRERRLIWGLYVVAAILTLPLILVWPPEALRAQPWFVGLDTGMRLNLIAGLALTVGLLVYSYQTLTSVVARQRLRLFVGGSILAFLPLLFSLLPETFQAAPLLPYEITLPWLLLSPLAYVYAIFRYRLVRVERLLNRAAGYYLLAILLLAIELAIELALLGRTLQTWPLANALLSVGLLLLALPLQKMLQHLMNWIWYGHTLHYIDVVDRLLGLLALTLDREALRQLVIDELPEALHLAGIALWIKDREDSLVLIGATGFDMESLADERLPRAGSLASYLARQPTLVSQAKVYHAMSTARQLPLEQKLLALPDVSRWVPLHSDGVLQGILLVGPWGDDHDLNAEYERILAMIARQSAIAVHNVLLIEQVHFGHRELARAHWQLLMEREQTQQRLAQDLHDGPVQQIFGISYQLGGLQRQIKTTSYRSAAGSSLPQDLEDLRHEIVGVGTQLRNMIGDVCPAGLDELGLTDALLGYVQQLQRGDAADLPEFALDLDESGTLLQETVAICLFRVAQEALRNVVKHAQATEVSMCLRLRPEAAMLTISDNGQGFQMPPRLTELTETNHFGLLGMTEYVAWVGGQLTIRSRVGVGTEVLAQIPLAAQLTDPCSAKQALAVGASS